ncbi:MAG: putative metal-binding motif-containing protein [Myxococcales bacterium]|nr:putative metal-binding motif-containing protein [Myxococcales bacterium]
MSLRACDHCDGLIPPARRRCPHCDRPSRARGAGRWLVRTACAGTALVTLMACYGMMRPYGPGDDSRDGDGDGVTEPTDCDDTRVDVYPGAADLEGDNVDQNCDGVDGWRDPSAPAPAPAAVATDPDEAAATPTPTPKAIAVDPP